MWHHHSDDGYDFATATQADRAVTVRSTQEPDLIKQLLFGSEIEVRVVDAKGERRESGFRSREEAFKRARDLLAGLR